MTDYPHDVLARKPVQIGDETKVDDLVPEMRERIGALLDLYGCDDSLEGWRALALALAMAHEPVFRLETPADRTGRSGLGGRPVTMEKWSKTLKHRQEWTKESEKGGTWRAVERRAAKRLDITEGAFRASVRSKGKLPDVMLRANYTVVAKSALERAAETLVEE